MKRFLLFICVAFSAVCCTKNHTEPGQPLNTEVRDYIASLGTLPQEGATSSEKQKLYSITQSVSYIDNPDKIGENNAGYYEMESARIREHASAVVTDIVPPTGSEGAIYPGALVQGKSVSEGEPVLIPIYDKRKAGRISLNVVSGDKSGISEEIRTFTKSEVGEAMNRIIGNYKSGFPANTAITYRAVHTLDEMAYHLGLDASVLRENFEPAYRRTATTKIMVRLSQIFFTMTYDQPGINDMFTTRLSVDELQRYCGTGNPPAYISSVSYGRCFVLLYESQAVSEPVLTAAISGVYCNEKDTLGITPRQRDIFKNKISNVTLLQIGGKSMDNPIEAIKLNPDAIRDFIVKGAQFSPDNVGAVVSYRVQYLANNTPLAICRTLDTEYETQKYIKVEDSNEVSLKIRGIHVPTIRKLPGVKGDLSFYSRCETRPLSITVYDERNRPVTTGSFDPQIKATTHKYEILRNYNHIFRAGKLGVSPEHRIVVEGSVIFRNKRLNRQDQTNEFPIRAEFRYNRDKREWEVFYDSDTQPGKFGDIRIYKEFAGCTSEMHIYYMFHTTFTTYPKREERNAPKPFL